MRLHEIIIRWLVLALFLMATVSFSCTTEKDGTDSKSHDDDSSPHGSVDDDSQDVATDDDAYGLDQVHGLSRDYPKILSAGWDPPEFTWTPECATTPCATFRFSVCDRMNNIFPDGSVYYWCEGCTVPFFGGPPFPASDYFDPSTDFSDCENPAESNTDLLLSEEDFTSGPGTYHVDYFIQVFDTEYNPSNTIHDLSFTVQYEG